MKILSYQANYTDEIRQLFTKVFSDSEGQAEGALVGDLAYKLMTTTDAHDLYGFIVVENEQIVGCIFFSRLTFQNSVNAFLLSPVAIQTSCQGKGIGQQLINYGLAKLKENGVSVIFTYGDPGFYSRVGFVPISEKVVKAPFKLSQPEGWLGQSTLSDKIEPIAGDSYCVEAFNSPDIW